MSAAAKTDKGGGGGRVGEEGYWTASDVARYFCVSRAWVYREVGADRLPHVRICGSLLRFRPQEIRALAAKSASAGDGPKRADLVNLTDLDR